MVCENSRNREANWDTRNHLSARVGHVSSSLYSETLIPREREMQKERERDTERQTDRQRERVMDGDREREREKENTKVMKDVTVE